MAHSIKKIKPAKISSELHHLGGEHRKASSLDKLFYVLDKELNKFLGREEIAILDKICTLVEYDYKNQNLIGRGYHCLEHSLELTVLLLKAQSNANSFEARHLKENSSVFPLPPQKMVELLVAALLHDYDPHSAGEPPRVERTLHVLMTDEILKDHIEKLKLRAINIELLIARTDYPFPPDKEVAWNNRLLFYFKDKTEMNRFKSVAEKLALFDKGSAYFYLSPAKAHQRIDELANELKYPKKVVLAQTFDFLKREKVSQLSQWLPKEYQQRWLQVEKYFKSHAQVIPGK